MNEQTIGHQPAVLLGEIAGVNAAGQPLVRWEGAAPRRAALAWSKEFPDWSKCPGLQVVLALIDGDEARPMILALAEAPPQRAMPKPTPAECATEVPESIHLESGKEFVIQCGKAKIALRADGRIEIRGGHLISRSSGPNKIKGGSVFIN